MDQQILDYIKSQKEKGFHEHQIKAALVHAGHPEHIVDEHMHFSKPGHKWLYISVAVVVLAVAIISIISLLKGPTANDLYYAGEYEAAKIEYQKLAEKHPDEYKYQFYLAVTLVELKEYEEALRLVESIPESDKYKYVYKGRVLYLIDDYPNANVSFTSGRLYNPYIPEPYIGLALIDYKLQNYDRAISILREGMAKTDSDCLAIYILAINSKQHNLTHDYLVQAAELNCPLNKEFSS